MNNEVSEAIQHVTGKIQKQLASGRRSRVIDAHDLVDILLEIAERIECPTISSRTKTLFPGASEIK